MADLTNDLFGKRVRCEDALLAAINTYRYLKVSRPKVVLEFGCDSGYLGLLCMLDAIGYVGCDVTQAFYLLQNRICGAAVGARFTELASEPLSFRDACQAM